MKVRDETWKDKIRRVVIFEKGDLKFIVEAYQYAGDEMRELDFEPEYEGDYFEDTFLTLTEALSKINELRKKGWESIVLRIMAENDWLSLMVAEKLNSTARLASVSITLDELNRSLTEKLSKIKRIIEEG